MFDSTALRDLYSQPQLPLFQNRLYATCAEARDCPRGDMRLVEDLATGLVRNAAFNSAVMTYDSYYNNEQGLSPQFQRHMAEVAALIEMHMGRERLVEVGCGKGTFLELMLARGCDLLGCDPTYEGTNPRVRKEYFSEALNIRCDGLILRHVLEHIEDPVGFLLRLAEANGGRGLIYIEVPCLDWISARRAWFDIFYEHVNYFRLSDLCRMFGKVLHADRGFGGQYLRFVADLSTLRRPVRDPNHPGVFPEECTDGLMCEMGSASGPCVVWGGASKGVIFSLLRERAGHPVDRVIDINPARQGRFLAATGLEVLSPEEGLSGLPKGSVIHVMNPNYEAEIQAMVGPDFICRGMSHV